jgi:hypothetical protein
VKTRWPPEIATELRAWPMGSSDPALNLQVGRRYRCTITLDCSAAVKPGAKGFLRAQWEPDLPRHLTKHDFRQYRAGRNALYRRAANVIGGNLMLVE